jgi:hypothetical protein
VRGEVDESLDLQLGDQLSTAAPSVATTDNGLAASQGLVRDVAEADGDGAVLLGTNAPAQATGLASLDVQLPRRGVEYFFTTPLGDVQINARAVDVTLLDRVTRLAWVLGLIIVIGVVYRWSRNRDLNDVIGRGTATVLILLGVVCLVLGLIPIVALAAIALGIVQHVRLFSARRAEAVVSA